MTTPPRAAATTLDPIPLLKGLGSLRRLVGTYPEGHPMIAEKLGEIATALASHFSVEPDVRVDVIQGEVFLNGVSHGRDVHGTLQALQELAALGVDSVHVMPGVTEQELLATARFLWQRKDQGDTHDGATGPSIERQLAERGVTHISLGRLLPLDTRWRAHTWPEAPVGPLDPDYAESLARAADTFERVELGERLDPVTVRDLVQLLIHKVARSTVALGQILAVKQYENLTYCHSVNVAMLSFLLGRRVGLDEATMATLVEAALLHDIGKTRIPLEVVKKPGALDTRERKLMEAHTTYGAEILVEIDGLHRLTPIVALEHHRSVIGTGYPDLGDGVVPHIMSQIVSVADIYEATTGARSYQAPMLPERACLVLARLAGEKLNTALVKAFVSAVTFFPIGSVVRTTREEVGVVVRTNPNDPLHPLIVPVNGAAPAGHPIDTGSRDHDGAYLRHIAETLRAHEQGIDVARILAA